MGLPTEEDKNTIDQFDLLARADREGKRVRNTCLNYVFARLSFHLHQDMELDHDTKCQEKFKEFY